MKNFINYLYDRANGITIFFTMGAVSALICYLIFYSLIVTDPSPTLKTSDIPFFSLIFGVVGGLLFLIAVLSLRKSRKFWDYAKIVEKLIDDANSKERLDSILKWEFETLRELCIGGPQITELNRLFTIMKTKYQYVK